MSLQAAAGYSRPRISNHLTWQLLLLCASGSLFSNLLIFRVGGFAVTPAHLFLVLATAATIKNGHAVNYLLAFTFSVSLLMEICHAAASGFIGHPEWHKSLGQFAAYGTCFIILTKFNLTKDTLVKSAPWVAKLAILMGGIGILQFILIRIGIAAFLPEALRVKGLASADTRYRSGGYAPAVGLATEPSYYAIGLVTLLACLIFLLNARYTKTRGFTWPAIIVLLVSILCTFSLAGIVISFAVLGGSLLSTKRMKTLALVVIIVIVAGILTAQRVGPFEYIYVRLQKTVQGLDNSAQIRVIAATRLLFTKSASLETQVLGTGLGMEDREQSTYLSVYKDASLRGIDQDAVKIHNIITAIRFYQGWLGVGLYIIMVCIILRPGAGKGKEFLPLLIFFALFHFASGLYLTPVFWSTLALMTLLRRVTPENREVSACQSG